MRLVTIISLLTLLVTTFAFANPPRTISFQGRVIDTGGGAIPDGNHSVPHHRGQHLRIPADRRR